ncbi:PLDc N-terminal domain-containing protein [Nonomuraea sp. NPDC050547]|uniref:PLDc N-terminal domain-containing protein n=1 Tax=unclassified Nonomuraea TaxID=2593643 RepID=UPI0037A200BA
MTPDKTTIVLLTLIPYMAIMIAFAIYCLIDLSRVPGVKHLPKWGWALACLLAMPLGGILYLAVGRDR